MNREQVTEKMKGFILYNFNYSIRTEPFTGSFQLIAESLAPFSG